MKELIKLIIKFQLSIEDRNFAVSVSVCSTFCEFHSIILLDNQISASTVRRIVQMKILSEMKTVSGGNS